MYNVKMCRWQKFKNLSTGIVYKYGIHVPIAAAKWLVVILKIELLG